jgi:hypothetical protein
MSEQATAPGLEPLRESFARSVAALDLRRSRQVILEAADGGVTLSRLYVDVVRPTLIAVAGSLRTGPVTAGDRLVLGSVQAALAMVASRGVDGAEMRGGGRRALVSIGDAPLDELDARVIVDVLRGDGWQVSEVPVDAAAEHVASRAAAEHVQLVVMPTSNAEDLLLSAATYTMLRRLADPPLIVACSFGRPDDTRRARAAGADGFVNDPDDLLKVIVRRLPGRNARNWGVRLRRLGPVLVVAPTGDLDEGSVCRLREVVGSREGTFDGVVVDTRDVASVTPEGLAALLVWMRAHSDGTRRFRVLPGALLTDALAGTALEAALLAAPADAGA